MSAQIALAALAVFTAGVAAGIIGVVIQATRREETNLILTSNATDHVTRAGRLLNGVDVSAPHRSAAARDTSLAWPPADQPQERPNRLSGSYHTHATAQAPLTSRTPCPQAVVVAVAGRLFPLPALSRDLAALSRDLAALVCVELHHPGEAVEPRQPLGGGLGSGSVAICWLALARRLFCGGLSGWRVFASGEGWFVKRLVRVGA